MSNLTIQQQRKNQISSLVDNRQFKERIINLFGANQAKAEKFRATIMNIALQPSLAQCSPASIMQSALQIAELELPLAKGLGQAYIVKYRNDAEAQIGYKGWLAIAERCGKFVKAKPVFKCDHFAMYDNGFDETVEFQPNFDERQDHDVKWVDSNLRGVLIAIKDQKTGVVSNNFVSYQRILKIAGKSPSRNSKYSPYSEWNLEMYQAKAIKYVVSKTPMSEQLAQAVELDNQRDIKAIEDKNKATSDRNEPSLDDLMQEDVIDVSNIDDETGEVKQ